VLEVARLMGIAIGDLEYERESSNFENQGRSDDPQDSMSYADNHKQIDIKVELFDDLGCQTPAIETDKYFINDKTIMDLSDGQSSAPLLDATDEKFQKSIAKQYHQDLLHCEECGKTFKSRRRLKVHKTNHSKIHLPVSMVMDIDTGLDKAAMKCKNCRKIFNSKEKLDQHVKNSCEKPHLCPYCSTKFFHFKNVRRHVRMKHANELVPSVVEQSYQCPYCPTKFFHVQNVKRHVKMKHENEDSQQFEASHQCPHCPTVFPHTSNLKRHIQLKHQNESNKVQGSEEMSHQCPHCPTKFFYARSVQRHVKSKHFIENVTDKTEVTKLSCSQAVIKDEEKIKCSLLLHKCSYCSEVFLKKKSLKIHKKKCQLRLSEETESVQKEQDTTKDTS